VGEAAGLLESGQASKALPLLELAHDLDDQSVPALINLGGAYVMTGRHKDAIPLLEAARDAEPRNPMIWINLGAAYLGNPILATPDQQFRAIEAFQTALELDPKAPSVHYNLGLIFVDRGEKELATAVFRQAIEVNPFDRDAHTWLQKLQRETAEEETP
jgi:tetratricopeptide (TPR) repeat protein